MREMTPRRSLAEAGGTRAAIVQQGVDVSSLEGLEGLTIGRLASDVGMSKAGLLGHFGSKEALQLAVLDAAVDTYRREIWEPVADAEPGLERLVAICDAWISYLGRGVFPGGCFMASAACEFDGRPGPVRNAIADALGRWYRLLESEVQTAIDAGDLPKGTDPRAIALRLNGLATGANQAFQLFGDRQALRLAHEAMLETLSVSPSRRVRKG
jgi:AcrR family transcriptional regulator